VVARLLRARVSIVAGVVAAGAVVLSVAE